METGVRPSLAGWLPTRELGKPAHGPARQRAVVGLGLRFALSAPPFGLRRAALRSGPASAFRPRHNQSGRTKDKTNRRSDQQPHTRKWMNPKNHIWISGLLMVLESGHR